MTVRAAREGAAPVRGVTAGVTATSSATTSAATSSTTTTATSAATSSTATTTSAADADTAALESDLRDGFFSDPPTIPPRWFYDEKGSLLFDQITRLDEYYPTRREAEILRERAAAIVGPSTTVVELGAGTCTKTRVLLDVLGGSVAESREGARDGSGSGATAGDPGHVGEADDPGASDRALARYVPVDISPEVLLEASGELAEEYPGVRIEPVIADLTALDALDEPLPGEPGQRLVLFLGGTIGNFDEEQRADFFRMLRGVMGPGDRLALGFDLVKAPHRLVAAYDDSAGVTAEFNLNMLDVIARTVACTGLDRRDFRHEAVWNAGDSRIEMWLRAVRDVRIGFPTLERTRTLAAGEGIRTEIARKFEVDFLVDELAGHGFRGEAHWTDAAGDFGLAVVVVD